MSLLSLNISLTSTLLQLKLILIFFITVEVSHSRRSSLCACDISILTCNLLYTVIFLDFALVLQQNHFALDPFYLIF